MPHLVCLSLRQHVKMKKKTQTTAIRYGKLHNLEPIFPKPEKQIDQSHEKKPQHNRHVCFFFYLQLKCLWCCCFCRSQNHDWFDNLSPKNVRHLGTLSKVVLHGQRIKCFHFYLHYLVSEMQHAIFIKDKLTIKGGNCCWFFSSTACYLVKE